MTVGDRERYSRQILFSGIGEAGQERLIAAHVGIAGCGALGSFQAEALARAGVGHLTLVDRDYVEASNLQRQWLYGEADARDGTPKAAAARRRIGEINSSIRVDAAVADLAPGNIDELFGEVSIILDGTDNFETRYLINDYCVRRGIPWIYGGAVGSYGVTMPLVPGAACFRCVYPTPPGGVQPTCETAGVLGALTASIAALQVAAAMKLICGEELRPTITMVDVWKGSMRQIEQPQRDPECPACGLGDFEYLEGKGRAPVSLCGRNAVQIHERSRPVDLEILRQQLLPLGQVRANEFGLRFFCEPFEMTVFADGRAIIKGTTDIGVARSLYAKYVGA